MQFESISIDQLVPNPWNPNEMSEEDFDRLVAEVKRMGKIAKPIVVRPKPNGRHEIIDGEHSWRAAVKNGLAEIPCEIENVDDFHAMLETFQRNQHGTHDPVKEGRMFMAMKQAGNLRGRQFSAIVGIPDSTIRSRKAYVQAADHRASVLGRNADKEIAQLTQTELDTYLKLPPQIRDKWLDAACPKLPKAESHAFFAIDLVAALTKSPLADHVSPSPLEFLESYSRVMVLLDLVTATRDRYGVDLEPFAVVLARHQISPDLLRLVRRLPSDKRRLIVEPATWAAIVDKAVAETKNSRALEAEIEAGLRRAMRSAQIDYSFIYSQHELEIMDWLNAAPPFLQDANYLTLTEKQQILQADLAVDEVQALGAKQLVVNELRRRRATGARKDWPRLKEKKLAALLKEAVLLVTSLPVKDSPEGMPTEKPQDPLCGLIQNCPEMLDQRVSGLPAAEALRAALAKLDVPLRVLFASALTKMEDPTQALTDWLNATRELERSRAVSEPVAAKVTRPDDEFESVLAPHDSELDNDVFGLEGIFGG